MTDNPARPEPSERLLETLLTETLAIWKSGRWWATYTDEGRAACLRQARIAARDLLNILAAHPSEVPAEVADYWRQVGAAEALDLLADLVVKATEFGEQDGGFIASYIMPTGPIHRAIPFLQERGITVRPGFDLRAAAVADSTGDPS